jgi:hypothetical protein
MRGYQQLLYRSAFDNFRQLLYDVTLNDLEPDDGTISRHVEQPLPDPNPTGRKRLSQRAKAAIPHQAQAVRRPTETKRAT